MPTFHRHLLMNEATDAPEGAAPAEESAAEPQVSEAAAGETALERASATAEEAPADPIAPEAAAEPDASAESPVLPSLAALHAMEGRSTEPAQQSRQAPALTPEVIAQMVARANESSPLNRLVAEALQRGNQPRPPQPPPDTAGPADWAAYTQAAIAYERQQSASAMQPMVQQVQQVQQQFRQMQQMLAQQQQQAQRQQYDAAVTSAIRDYANLPQNAWMKTGAPDDQQLRAIIIKNTYEQARAAGWTLPDVIAHVGRAFGAQAPAPKPAAPSPAAASAKALAVQRQRASGARVTPGKGGSAGSAPKGMVDKLKANGTWDTLAPDLQQLYQMKDAQRLN